MNQENTMDNTKEYILCAAVKRKEPRPNLEESYTTGTNDLYKIEIGYRHHDIYNRFLDENGDGPLDIRMEAQGFYTSRGRFVDRYEGMKIAYFAGQVDHKTALDKSWHHKILFQGTDDKGNVLDENYWDEHDTEEFNMLTSEDLY